MGATFSVASRTGFVCPVPVVGKRGKCALVRSLACVQLSGGIQPPLKRGLRHLLVGEGTVHNRANGREEIKITKEQKTVASGIAA
jgi:hypothetical protein